MMRVRQLGARRQKKRRDVYKRQYESLDLDLSYYNSLRVFNLLQNEDLELYPKR